MRSVKMNGHSSVSVVEVPEPVPGPGEVVVETAVSALCGSELGSYRGEGQPQGNGGHEAAGTVVRLGEGVSGLALGARVGVSAVSGCGVCAYCAKRQYTWCPGRKGYGDMHAERFVASARACYPLPDDVPWDAGVLLSGDGMGVPYHTSCKIRSDEVKTVAVFGAGPVGLGNILMQAHLGRRVIAVDIVPGRLELARKLGAADVVDAREGDAAAAVRKLCGSLGADVCIEAAGRPQTALACFAAARTAGTVVFNGEQGELALSPSEHFIRRDITAVGSWFYHFAEIDAMLALYRGGLRITDLITAHYSLEDAPAAFAAFAAGLTGKVIISY